MHTVAARSVAEQPRLLHRRLDGGEELYFEKKQVKLRWLSLILSVQEILCI